HRFVETIPVCDDGGTADVLHFRHKRRLTLETSCLLMGRVVPVSVYEECRSDFWCEAEVPAALTSLGKAACPAEMCVPKECIPLILDDNHPMRMQTILDASDLRQLSVLIADRLKLCRLGSARTGPRSYRYWLESTMDRGDQSGDLKASAGFLDTECHTNDQSGQEFKLSLRKRSVGQVVFSRLVSFWVPSPEDHGLNEANGDASFARDTQDGILGKPNRLKTSTRQIVQRLVTVKEFSHRGGCGELRGEVHDTDSGGPAESFTLAPQLTRTLLRDWRAELKRSDKKKNPSLDYWRDALTWRLGIVPQAACFLGSSEMKVDDRDLRRRSTRATRSSSMKRDGAAARVAVDERTPLLRLRHIAAGLAPTSVNAGERRVEMPAACNNCFDMLILPVRPETGSVATHGTLRERPAIEFLITHRRTMAVFSFIIPIKAFVRELDGFVAACLTTPTSLSLELELPSPGQVLRKLAGKWLRYSAGQKDNGNRPVMTLSFARKRPITAEPIVGLRRTRRNDSIVRGRGARDRHVSIANQNGVCNTVDREIHLEERNSVGGTKYEKPLGGNHGGTHGSSHANTKHRNSCRSTSTVQLEPRNERMIFRRKVVVPRRRDHLMRHENHRSSGQRGPLEGKQGGVDEEASKVLSVSVYETFSAGHSGKIERDLKFLARDEAVRPVIEAVSIVPWVGTCEGVEGGTLWRVVTQGLSFEYTRDETGKRMGIRLKVSTEHEIGDPVVSSNGEELEGQAPDHRAPTRSCGEGAQEDRRSKESGIGMDRATQDRDKNMPKAVGFALNPGKKGNNGGMQCSGGCQVEGNALCDKHDSFTPAGGPLGKKCDHIASAGGSGPMTLDLLEGRRRGDGEREEEDGSGENAFPYNRPIKIYTGWHRITGIRLHVHCFQEVYCCSKETHPDPYATKVGSNMTYSKCRPAGRGGVSSFPPSASLRFIVCNPGTACRTEVKISVEDMWKNLSTDGGIVDAELLDPGRRPALAKAIAENLRLVFEADGGYSVVLPLPASWVQA
ncbi:unnamed protein product, partial [Hapterophycus canaliculatus]